MKAKEQNDQTKSGNESEESEEFQNFDRGMEQILSLSPKEAEEIRNRVPVPNERETRHK